MVMPIATATTMRISSAVRPKSLRTSGKRGRSTVYAFFSGTASELVVTVSSVCDVTSVVPRLSIRLPELVLVLRRAERAAVDGQQIEAGDFAVRADFDFLRRRTTLLVPRGDTILPRGDVERVIPLRVGETVVRRRHDVHDRGHVRMDVAIDVDDAGRLELVRFARALAIQAEVERVAGGERE